MRTLGIVLAAGLGKRMKSGLYKVLHPVCGKPMVGHVVDRLEEIGADRIVAVVGHGAEAVKEYLGNRAEYALQPEQLGTAHAVMQAAPLLKEEDGISIVLCGDTPLISRKTIVEAVEKHRVSGAACTIVTAVLDDPAAYGRIIRGSDGSVEKIVEFKDCTPDEAAVREINTGTYVFDNRLLFEAVGRVSNDNRQGEYYLTDVVAILKRDGHRIEGYVLEDASESIGVNDRAALAEAERLMRIRINRSHMLDGVTIIDPDHTYIDAGVEIGRDTVIRPGTHLAGSTVIGSGCVIGPNTEVTDSRIGDGVTISHSVLVKCRVESGAAVGPFAYIRPDSQIGEGVKIGDFVEIKNSLIGKGSKVPHLSYVGDASIGEGVNIGCGVITANYDGVNKHRTTVEDGAFIGSNVNLIAPVTIGKGAYVVAGSTITGDVPADSLAIARARQTNKEGYASRLRARISRQAPSKP
jgi:bifunctional UDP-N-acetylglucosamine pyrophosphorylase/glucosamine-1-phosphate N-acetyltransferase